MGTYFIRHRDKHGRTFWKSTPGYPIALNGWLAKYEFFAHQDARGKWMISERNTGFGVLPAHENSRVEARAAAARRLREVGEEEFTRVCGEAMQAYGVAPTGAPLAGRRRKNAAEQE